MPEVRLGKLLLQNKLATAGQIQDALVKQLSTPEIPLGQILCKMGVLLSEDLELLLDRTNKRRKLTDILIKNQVITEIGLQEAIHLSQGEGIRLEKALLKLNLLSEENLARAIASQYDLPYMDITQFNLEPEQALILNANFVQKHKIVPVATDGHSITIAMAFPLPRNELKQIENFTQYRIIPVIAKERDIFTATQQLYKIESPQAAVKPAPSFNISGNATPDAVNANVDYLVKKLLFLGISKEARDIHFEPTEKGISVRYRIDGILQTLNPSEDQALINANRQQIISRIKTLCDMDIVERRRPQDGSFTIKAIKAGESRRFDFRVSTAPGQYGENMVIRIFDKQGKIKTIENLGYFPNQIKSLNDALNKSAGVFLVTGPADSGKSSTLLAMLLRIISPESKTLTVEDPIEHTIDGITQTEVNEAIGNTSAKLLQTFLRQDPDNILIGEIRHPEIAEIAFHAALSGRTVLGALLCNDSTDAVTRLLDMGIAAGIVSSSLRCVLAQRLVRRICRQCTVLHTPSLKTLQAFGLASLPALKIGRGCAVCNYTGYSGRQPVIEIWLPTRDELVDLTRQPDSGLPRQRVFSHGKRKTILEDGFDRVLSGETTLEELLRVIPHDQIESDRDRLKPMLDSYAQ